MQLAAHWAADLDHERQQQHLSSHAAQPELLVEQSELKAMIAMCHYLVLVACGCSGDVETGTMRSMEPFAGQLCKHMLLVRLYAFCIPLL